MTYLGIILFALCISIHELGHAFAMRRLGIQMKEICILGIGPKLFTFKIRYFFGNVPITVRLFPIAAFVEPTKFGSLRMKLMPYGKSGYIAGAGPVANFLFAGMLMFLSMTVNGVWTEREMIFVAILIAVGLFPRYSFHLMVPLGVAFVSYVLYTTIQAPKAVIDGSGSMIAIGEMIHENSQSLGSVLYFVSIISLSIGIMNSIPFMPLDGGRIVYSLIPSENRRLRFAYAAMTSIPVFVLIFFSLKNDIVRLFHYF